MDVATTGTTALSEHEARATGGGLTVTIWLGPDLYIRIELPIL